MFDNGTADVVESEIEELIKELPPLKTTRFEKVRELRRRLKEAKEKKKQLKRRRLTRRKRIVELEREFKAALEGKGDRSPKAIREERVEIEREKDHYHERRLELEHEIATLEEALEEEAAAAAETIAEAAGPAWEELEARLARRLEALGRLLVVMVPMGAQLHSYGPHPGSARVDAGPGGQFNRFLSGLAATVRRRLSDLKGRHDVDETLIRKLGRL